MWGCLGSKNACGEIKRRFDTPYFASSNIISHICFIVNNLFKKFFIFSFSKNSSGRTHRCDHTESLEIKVNAMSRN